MQDLLLRFVLSLQVVLLVSCDASGQRANSAPTAKDADHRGQGKASDRPGEQASAPDRPFSRYTFSPNGQYVLADDGWGWWPPDGEAALWKARDGSFVRRVRSFKESPNVPLTQQREANQLVFDRTGTMMILARGKVPRPVRERIRNCGRENGHWGTSVCS